MDLDVIDQIILGVSFFYLSLRKPSFFFLYKNENQGSHVVKKKNDSYIHNSIYDLR